MAQDIAIKTTFISFYMLTVTTVNVLLGVCPTNALIQYKFQIRVFMRAQHHHRPKACGVFFLGKNLIIVVLHI